MNIHRLMLLAVLMLPAACSRMTDPQTNPAEDTVPIELSVKTSDGLHTRGIITGTSLGDGSRIGLTLCDISGTTYQKIKYENILHTAEGEVPDQTWSGEEQLMVSNTPGTLYGYYPYSESVTDMSTIAVTADSQNQTDYLYATPVRNITKANASAAVVMNHALAAVRLTVSRGTYTGDGNVTGASVSGADIGTSALLNARTGSLTEISGYSEEIAPAIEPFTLTSGGSSVDILVVPCCEAGQNLKVRLNIDGNLYTAEIPSASISQGKMTECKIAVNDGQVYVTSVAVTAWRQDAAGSQITQKDYAVSLAGNMEGLSFSNSVDEDGNVAIIAVPYLYEDTEVKPVTITGTATLEQSADDQTGILTIKLSDIASDVTVTFSGFYLWMTLKYDVTDISAETKVHNMGTASIARQQIDGEEITPSKTYQFTTTGEHTMRLALTNYKTVPGSAFYYTPTITEAVFPEGVKSLGSWAFIGCSKFKKVSLPSTLTSIGYQAFERSGIESCIIPDGCSMSYGIFDDCYSLTYAKLPSDITMIPNGTFSGCCSLAQFEMPEGVTAIGTSAFEATALETFSFPDAVSVIDEEVLMSCTSLKEVRLPANMTTIKRQAFYNCTALEKVILSDGTECSGEFVIPEGVTSVQYMSVMFKSPSIKTIRIPSTLTGIEDGGLASPMIEGFTMTSSNPKYDIRNNSLVETTTDILVAGGTASSIIHESVTSIGNSAFMQSNIATVDLHENISSIGDRAFYYAYPSTVISRSVTPPTLGTECFWIAQYNGVLKVPEEGLTAYREQWMINELGYLGWSTAKWGLYALAEDE